MGIFGDLKTNIKLKTFQWIYDRFRWHSPAGCLVGDNRLSWICWTGVSQSCWCWKCRLLSWRMEKKNQASAEKADKSISANGQNTAAEIERGHRKFSLAKANMCPAGAGWRKGIECWHLSPDRPSTVNVSSLSVNVDEVWKKDDSLSSTCFLGHCPERKASMVNNPTGSFAHDDDATAEFISIYFRIYF